MNVTINKKAYEMPEGITVVEALEIAGRPTTGIAVAINGNVVRANELKSAKIADGDSLMVIKAFYGG